VTSARALLAVPLAVAALAFVERAHAAEECPPGATCATITVPLDHSGVTPGTLPLTYARVPATGTKTGTIVYLAGGPGQAAIPLTRRIAARLRSLREHYDFVLPDQRGTGRSDAAQCGVGSDAAVVACGGKLGDRRAYWTTPETALDIEDMRRVLGEERLVLLANSYGTMVAEEYGRRFPEHVAALILDSPVSPDGIDLLGVEFVRTLPGVLRALCTADCRHTVGDPVQALVRAVRRLRQAPVRGTRVTRNGDVSTGEVNERRLFDALSTADVNLPLRVELPAAIESLARGDAAPLIHAYQLWVLYDKDAASPFNIARQAATLCIEGSLPWAPDSPLVSRDGMLRAFEADHSFAPFSSKTALAASFAPICRLWPPTPRPPSAAGMTPDVPVLVLSGREDMRTPLEGARRVAAKYPRSTLVDVPYVGHAVLASEPSYCGLRALEAFLGGRPVVRCDRLPREDRPNRIPADIYRPGTLRSLTPFGPPGRAGKLLHAVDSTVNVAWRDRNFWEYWYGLAKRVRLPGMRGGYVVATPRGVELHSAELFRGVRVSGTMSLDDVGRFSVDGPAAADGTVTFRHGRVTGMLAGRAIRDRY
jgi:pimeloyl-ACP methyl ester carboxylesterase